MAKKISVIVPCYMVEQYIDRCVKSLLNQSIGLEHLELIFINDASPDRTLDKLLEYESQYPETILVINSEENLKQGGARNLGLQYATADYIGFVDSDDWVEPSMYEKLYNKAIAYDCDIVSCEYKRVYDEETPMGPTGAKDRYYIIEDESSRKVILLSGIGSGVTKIIKKSLIQDNHIRFPEHLAYEDNLFGYLLLFYVKKIYIIAEFLYHYFANMQSTIIKPEASYHFDRLTVELMKQEELKLRGFYDTYYREIEFNFLTCYYLNTIHIIFTRFNKVPIDITNQMGQELMKRYPDYLNNPYLESLLVNTYKQFLRMIPLTMNQEQWDQIAEAYRR